MAIDVQKLFNEELPARLAKHSELAAGIGARARVHVTGEGGGVWFIDATPSGPSAKKGNPGGAHVGITISVEDFRTLTDNPEANGKRLFLAGKLKVSGNPQVALRFTELFRLGDP